jgi:hypothetical protein
MGMTNAGATFAAQAITNDASPVFFTNANAYLGVGDSATAFVATQTDLVGGNKFRKVADATYPQRSTNVVTFRSTFATSEANFTWAEWGTFNATTAGTMLSRKVDALGTKTAAQSWQLTATITFVAA